EEERGASRATRLAYRLFRHSFVLLIVGPAIQFLLSQRLPGKGSSERERRSVLLTNLAIIALIGLASVTMGLRTYLLIQVPIAALGASIGVWLFYVQHQF
ncbi:MAG: fatty acid desaturase, partial [Chloroflexota bacterium]